MTIILGQLVVQERTGTAGLEPQSDADMGSAIQPYRTIRIQVLGEQMLIKTEKKEGSLRDRLKAISKRLDSVNAGKIQTDVVEYERSGDRVSVMIRPRIGSHRAA